MTFGTTLVLHFEAIYITNKQCLWSRDSGAPIRTVNYDFYCAWRTGFPFFWRKPVLCIPVRMSGSIFANNYTGASIIEKGGVSFFVIPKFSTYSSQVQSVTAAPDSAQQHTVAWIPLNEWSARHRDLYLTKHNTRKRQTSIHPAGFEPPNPSKHAAVNPLLWPRGHLDRQKKSPCRLSTPVVPRLIKCIKY